MIQYFVLTYPLQCADDALSLKRCIRQTSRVWFSVGIYRCDGQHLRLPRPKSISYFCAEWHVPNTQDRVGHNWSLMHCHAPYSPVHLVVHWQLHVNPPTNKTNDEIETKQNKQKPKKKMHQLNRKLTWSSALQSSSSLFSLNGSRLSRIVPENRIASCGIMEIFLRNWYNGMVDISTSSILIMPWLWAKRKMAWIMELLPAPVLPQMPIFSPGFILRFNDLSIRWLSSEYFNDKSLNTISPLFAQLSKFVGFSSGLGGSIFGSFSGFKFMYSITRSTEVM